MHGGGTNLLRYNIIHVHTKHGQHLEYYNAVPLMPWRGPTTHSHVSRRVLSSDNEKATKLCDHGGSPDMPSLQLRQPALDPVSGENFADIESSSSIGEDAAQAPSQGAHEPLPEPAAR